MATADLRLKLLVRHRVALTPMTHALLIRASTLATEELIIVAAALVEVKDARSRVMY
jgi:hypothetical protein